MRWISGAISIMLCGAFPMVYLIKDMKSEDKVRTLSFSVCGAFLFGDHLAFTANYQPSLILPVMLGKLFAAVIAVVIANKIIIPRVLKKRVKHNEQKTDVDYYIGFVLYN